MGRHPDGPKIARKLRGSDGAKQRLEAILETVAGRTNADGAAEALGVSAPLVYELRLRALQAALESLEPGVTGRPPKPKPSPEALRVQELEARVAELETALTAAGVRAELAALRPTPAKKKSRPRRSRATLRTRRAGR